MTQGETIAFLIRGIRQSSLDTRDTDMYIRGMKRVLKLIVDEHEYYTLMDMVEESE